MPHSLRLHRLQHTRPPCPSLSPGVCPSSCPLNWSCYSTISSSIAPFSSCLQSFPASGSFPISWLFTLGCQRIGASASAEVLPVSIQCWLPLELTGLTSLEFKGLSGVFSSTTVWKHEFVSTLSSLWSNCTWLIHLYGMSVWYICKWLLEKS